MIHTPVLLQAVIEYLNPRPGARFIDATAGGGGHSAALMRQGVIVLGIDRDRAAVQELTRTTGGRSGSEFVHGNFADLHHIAQTHGFTAVAGILFDLGMSSLQLDDEARGFAFQKDGPLDMRFDQEQELTAARLVNEFSEKDLLQIFQRFGEEWRFGKKIARAIVQRRRTGSLTRTTELFDLIKKALPASFRFRAGDVARKIFQSLRIAVNDELVNLERALPQALSLLERGGRLVVISFQSLEDRIVKNFFVQAARDCICPPSFPVCRCDHRATLTILTKHPVVAAAGETKTNPRAKSAKLRAAQKI